MFCCGRRGANYLIINTAQFFYIMTILFLSFKLTTVQFEFQPLAGDSAGLAVHCVMLTFALILLGYLWAYVIPQMLTSFTLTTNIEMMKDRQLVYKVISMQRMERSKRSFRIYQVLKLVRREMIVEFRKKVPDKKINKEVQKHIIESFLICGNTQDGKIGPILRND